ncbi:MAG: hypothetical protein U0837_10725 [Dehalococcoidia bacterium]|jgi:Arc/MetJ-type ribon-helix-helix transcriptional regulator
MKVELSERSWQTVENLVQDGSFPTAQAVVEAAIDALAVDWDGIDVDALIEEAARSRREGTLREANEEYVAELVAKARAIIDSKSLR